MLEHHVDLLPRCSFLCYNSDTHGKLPVTGYVILIVYLLVTNPFPFIYLLLTHLRQWTMNVNCVTAPRSQQKQCLSSRWGYRHTTWDDSLIKMKDVFSAPDVSTPARAFDKDDDVSRGIITPDVGRVDNKHSKLPPRSPHPLLSVAHIPHSPEATVAVVNKRWFFIPEINQERNKQRRQTAMSIDGRNVILPLEGGTKSILRSQLLLQVMPQKLTKLWQWQTVTPGSFWNCLWHQLPVQLQCPWQPPSQPGTTVEGPTKNPNGWQSLW
jgi:hypothetical protein